MNRNGYFHFISVSCCSFFNLPFFFLKFFYFTTKKKIDHTFTKMHSFSIQILCCFFSAKNRPVISYRMPTTTSKQRNGKYIAIDWFLILILFFVFFSILQPKLKIKIESNPSRFDPSNVIKKKNFEVFFSFQPIQSVCKIFFLWGLFHFYLWKAVNLLDMCVTCDAG